MVLFLGCHPQLKQHFQKGSFSKFPALREKGPKVKIKKFQFAYRLFRLHVWRGKLTKGYVSFYYWVSVIKVVRKGGVVQEDALKFA